MNLANVIMAPGIAYAQGSVDSTPPANPDLNSNTGIGNNGVNPNTGDSTGPGAIRDSGMIDGTTRDAGAAGTVGPQDGSIGPINNDVRTPDPAVQNSQLNPDRPANDASTTNTTTTQSAVGVPDNTALNTDEGLSHVGIWAIGILLVAAFLVWAALRARGQTTSSTKTTRRTATTRTATHPR